MPGPRDWSPRWKKIVTPEVLEAASAELGWEPEMDWLIDALNETETLNIDRLHGRLTTLQELFTSRGGRGVELAEEIDRLRAVIAVRPLIH